eukprot:3941201-Rhodomonas_salina.1
MSGTDIPYAAPPSCLLGKPAPIVLRLCYAMSGTDIGYAAPRLLLGFNLVVPPPIVLCDVWY